MLLHPFIKRLLAITILFSLGCTLPLAGSERRERPPRRDTGWRDWEGEPGSPWSSLSWTCDELTQPFIFDQWWFEVQLDRRPDAITLIPFTFSPFAPPERGEPYSDWIEDGPNDFSLEVFSDRRLQGEVDPQAPLVNGTIHCANLENLAFQLLIFFDGNREAGFCTGYGPRADELNFLLDPLCR